jgi:hypothetical protein
MGCESGKNNAGLAALYILSLGADLVKYAYRRYPMAIIND